jgi:DnaJ-domain-containing protein 1
MNIIKEFNELTDVLKQQRDEIEVQIHLAAMEVKDEWQHSEKKWGEFIETLGIITDDTKETSSELIHAAKIIGDELNETYNRISERLRK